MKVHSYYQHGGKVGYTNGFQKFAPSDVAETIALAGPGEEVPSTFEPFKQMRYTLADGRIWYASLKTGVQIENLELGQGEMFRVGKRAFGKGSVVSVQRCHTTDDGCQMSDVGKPKSEIRNPKSGSDTGSVLSAQLQASIAAVERAKATGAPEPEDADDPGPAAQPVTMEPAAPRVRGTSTKQANRIAVVPAPAIATNGAGESATSLAMRAAIDVCAEGQKYAAGLGMSILFVGEDVRTIMNTILIGQQKRGY